MKTPKAMGFEKPGIVAVTVLLAVAITDTVPATVPWASFASLTVLPSGVTATPKGLLPTGIMAVTVLLAVAITDTVLSW